MYLYLNYICQLTGIHISKRLKCVVLSSACGLLCHRWNHFLFHVVIFSSKWLSNRKCRTGKYYCLILVLFIRSLYRLLISSVICKHHLSRCTSSQLRRLCHCLSSTYPLRYFFLLQVISKRRTVELGYFSIIEDFLLYSTLSLLWMTKTEFLLTISLQYQADRWWEWREIT